MYKQGKMTFFPHTIHDLIWLLLSRPVCNIVVGRLTGAKEKDKFLINLSFIEGNENSHRIFETIQVV